MKEASSLYIGLMSGTSLDGIDAVLAEIDPHGNASPVHCVSTSFDPSLREALLALQHPGENEIHRDNQAANALAIAYADCVHALLLNEQLSPAAICAIGAHGQTIRHQAQLTAGLAYTHQTLNPALLAELTGIDVIADFRSRDLAAGGQGAPLVPAFHAQQFGSTTEARAVLNLGGIANLTLLPRSGSVTGFDCGPGNVLLDAWIDRNHNQALDLNGAWAASGHCDVALLQSMLSDPFFTAAPPKSTGRDDFHLDWLLSHLKPYPNLSPVDIQATLLELTAHAALEAIARYAPVTERLLVCGGGAKNTALMNSLSTAASRIIASPLEVCSTSALGLDPQWVEGLAFAWLAWAHKTKRPANLPAVTGAKGPRILGACYPA